MGTIKTTNIETISGSGTLTIGTSGETIALGTGVVQSNMLYPAFMVKLSGTQNITTATWTKVTFDSEVFDTDSAFASNKFTVPSGEDGKYFFSVTLTIDDLEDGKGIFTKIYKNGAAEGTSLTTTGAAATLKTSIWSNWIDDAAADDYYEVYVYHDIGSTEELRIDYQTTFMGYRIGT